VRDYHVGRQVLNYLFDLDNDRHGLVQLDDASAVAADLNGW